MDREALVRLHGEIVRACSDLDPGFSFSVSKTEEYEDPPKIILRLNCINARNACECPAKCRAEIDIHSGEVDLKRNLYDHTTKCVDSKKHKVSYPG